MRLEKTSEYAREEAKSNYIQIYIKIDECLGGGGKKKFRKKVQFSNLFFEDCKSQIFKNNTSNDRYTRKVSFKKKKNFDLKFF